MRPRGAILLLILTLLVGGAFSAPAGAHLPTVSYAVKRIKDTKVNGLCGKGSTYFCSARSHIFALYLYSVPHWHVFKVQYAEGRYFWPGGSRHCVVGKVSVSHSGTVGTPTKPDYCYK